LSGQLNVAEQPSRKFLIKLKQKARGSSGEGIRRIKIGTMRRKIKTCKKAMSDLRFSQR
jgi:hypothetical protein